MDEFLEKGSRRCGAGQRGSTTNGPSFAPTGLGPSSGLQPTAYAVGCILAPHRGLLPGQALIFFQTPEGDPAQTTGRNVMKQEGSSRNLRLSAKFGPEWSRRTLVSKASCGFIYACDFDLTFVANESNSLNS